MANLTRLFGRGLMTTVFRAARLTAAGLELGRPLGVRQTVSTFWLRDESD